jgi:polysaccharide biosynthesis protein PslG
VSDGAAIVYEPDRQRIRELNSIRALGARWVRYDFAWSALEPRRGSYRFGRLERAVAEASARNLSVVAMLGYAPRWANGGRGDKYAPLDPADYGSFAGKVAARFGRLGVHTYELWNEPNTSAFFAPTPDPDLYAAMVKAAYPPIKRADPRARVLAGALASIGGHQDVNCDGISDGGRDSNDVNQVDFLAWLYADGAGHSFDAVSAHPYDSGGFAGRCSGWAQLQQTSPSLRSVMQANGDRTKQLWVTEYGNRIEWLGGDEGAVADRLRLAMSSWRTYPWAGPMLVFNLWNAQGSPFGLLRPDWSKRPSWFAFRRVASRRLAISRGLARPARATRDYAELHPGDPRYAGDSARPPRSEVACPSWGRRTESPNAT